MMYEYTNCEKQFSLKLALWVIAFFISLQLAAQDSTLITHHYFNNFEDSLLNKGWMNLNTIFQGSDSAGNHFSKTDGSNQYSSGIEIEIPADLKRKNFRITVKGLIRITNAMANNQLVISIAKGDSAIFWKGEHVPDSTGKVNEWSSFSVSNLIPRNIPKDAKVKIFLWNADGKSETGLDDLDINFTEVKFPSFLPN